MNAARLLAALICLLAVVGCDNTGTDTPAGTTTSTETAPPPAPTTSVVAPTAAPTVAPEVPIQPTAEIPALPMAEEAPPAPEPYIVDCQLGLGEIVTYWSDGSVTGYSDYCQSVHDQALASEVAANTPVCDGTTCRYPSGATMPDPAASATPSPWVQDQLDWAACIDAGNPEEYCRVALN